MTHSFFIGLAPGPDSPPTITQSIRQRSRQGNGPSSGSMERKLDEGRNLTQLINSVHVPFVLHTYSHPDLTTANVEKQAFFNEIDLMHYLQAESQKSADPAQDEQFTDHKRYDFFP